MNKRNCPDCGKVLGYSRSDSCVAAERNNRSCNKCARQKQVADRYCSIDGCERGHFAKTYCAMHYQRFNKTGNPLRKCNLRGESIKTKLQHYTNVQSNGCVVWVGSKDGGGYGILSHKVEDRRTIKAHRASWEIANGKTIPDGMVVRHRCDNPSCVNPDHLEIGTQRQNVADAIRRQRR